MNRSLQLLLAFGLCWFSPTANAQSVTSTPRPSYQPFRYDEDWSSLSDHSQRSDWLDPVKYLPLRGDNWYATIGGEIRESFELLDQPGFGTGPEDKNGYFLQRYLLASDFHLGSRVRAYAELQSGLKTAVTEARGPRIWIVSICIRLSSIGRFSPLRIIL